MPSPTFRSHRQNGFTLVELMVSIAIALVLILGVNQVFKIGAQTVGAGQAFSEITRDERAAHLQVYTDVHNAVTISSPAMLISSQRTWAYRNQQDWGSGAYPSNTIVVNGTPQTLSNVLLNDRNHRFDTVGFFASGDLYQRQTADNGSFVSAVTSSNAWIWYGHMALPNNAQISGAGGDWFDPGSLTGLSGGAGNNNNFFASDWMLGRMAMLLVPGAASLGSPNANYFAATAGNPLAYTAVATDGSSPIYSSRYDLVAATMNYFSAYNSVALRSNMVVRPTGTAQYNIFRYEGNPYPTKPLASASMAAAAPIFLKHCTQFIVEYAGDYLTQDNNPYNADGSANLNYGSVGMVTNPTTKVIAPVTGAQGDGVVDFTIDPASKAANPTNPGLWIRKIRWYGFPRDTNGDGAIDLQDDVVPLRDVLQAASPTGAGQSAGQAPWETFANLPVAANYVGATADNAQYICSWGSETAYPLATGTSSGLPRMLRITLALDDPNGRLASPQTYEYVIDLGAQQ